ncbi:DUF6538 domain-containing protein [Nioella nitratireducens]
MGITPHLVLRGTTYYFRMAVPRHLVKKVGRRQRLRSWTATAT